MNGRAFDPHKLHGDEARLAALNGNECRGKVRHPSKRHALSAGRATLRNGQSRVKHVLNVYRCKHCGKWHLGNTHRALVARGLVDDSARVVRTAPASSLELALADALRPHLAAH